MDGSPDMLAAPAPINTSLKENEPVVRGPAEAIDCFLRTSVDAPALGNHALARG